MRQRDPSIAVVSILILLIVLRLNDPTGDKPREVIHRTPPAYPELAREMRLGGAVTLVVSIDPDGSVGDVKVQSGHPWLAQSAVDAVKTWKYAPSTLATEATVSINFAPH